MKRPVKVVFWMKGPGIAVFYMNGPGKIRLLDEGALNSNFLDIEYPFSC